MKKNLFTFIFFMLASMNFMVGCVSKSDKKEEIVKETSTETESTSSNLEKVNKPENSTGGFTSFKTIDLEANHVDQQIFADYDLTMVNIWGTYCGPCLNEMPELGELNQEYADKKFQVVGIVIDVMNQDGSFSQDQIELAQELVKETGADYRHLLPSNDLIMAKLKDVSAIPETVFVNSKGEMIESYMGAKSKDDWKQIIEQLLD